MGLWAPLWLSLYFLPELSCRCSHLWSYLPAGPQIYPIDRYLSSWMGWGPLVHTILSAWQVLDSYSCLFFSPVCGLVSFSSWQEHLDGPWIRFIACHFRGCQSCLWLEVGLTFTERATHFGICWSFFFKARALLHWSRVWRKKWTLLSAFLKDDSVVCPPGKVLLWVCDVGNPHSRFRLAADCPRWSSQCSSTYCADELSLYQQVGPTSLLPGWRLKEAKEWFLLDLKM